MNESDKSEQPRIMLHFMRDQKTAELNKIRMVPFNPGMIINRCGKTYMVDANGTQRRIK